MAPSRRRGDPSSARVHLGQGGSPGRPHSFAAGLGAGCGGLGASCGGLGAACAGGCTVAPWAPVGGPGLTGFSMAGRFSWTFGAPGAASGLTSFSAAGAFCSTFGALGAGSGLPSFSTAVGAPPGFGGLGAASGLTSFSTADGFSPGFGALGGNSGAAGCPTVAGFSFGFGRGDAAGRRRGLSRLPRGLGGDHAFAFKFAWARGRRDRRLAPIRRHELLASHGWRRAPDWLEALSPGHAAPSPPGVLRSSASRPLRLLRR